MRARHECSRCFAPYLDTGKEVVAAPRADSLSIGGFALSGQKVIAPALSGPLSCVDCHGDVATTGTAGWSAKQQAVGFRVAAHPQVGAPSPAVPHLTCALYQRQRQSCEHISTPTAVVQRCDPLSRSHNQPFNQERHTNAPTHSLTHAPPVPSLMHPLNTGSSIPAGGLPQINSRGGRNRSRAADSRRIRRPTSCNF